MAILLKRLPNLFLFPSSSHAPGVQRRYRYAPAEWGQQPNVEEMMNDEERNARVTAFMARAQRNPRGSSFPVSAHEDPCATMKARQGYLNLASEDGLDPEDRPEGQPSPAPSEGNLAKLEHPRRRLTDSMIRVERWWRTIDRVQNSELDPAGIQWQRFTDDAHYIRESLIQTLQYLSNIEYMKRSGSRERLLHRAAMKSEPVQAAKGVEYYSQVWRDLPRVEAWVDRVQALLRSDDSEILIGTTRDQIPVVVSALDDAAELLDYLRSFVERQG